MWPCITCCHHHFSVLKYWMVYRVYTLNISSTSHKIVFWMKTSVCRDGTLNQMGMTSQHFHIIPTSCVILPLVTQICFVCLLVMCRGLWKAVWWVVLGVHVDVHWEWVILWVAAMYNVLAILSMADMVCLACMQKLWSPWAVLAGSVWYVWYTCIWSVWYVGV